jgi:hemerythrin-like metal-binding protein
MALLSWKEAYRLGLPEIDRQHQHLVEMIERLNDALEQAAPKMVMQSALSDLVTYTRLHFQTEEELMRRHGFPDRLDHCVEHDRLLRKVESLEEALRVDRAQIDRHTMAFLKDWISQHMMEADVEYAVYMHQIISNVTEMPACRL